MHDNNNNISLSSQPPVQTSLDQIADTTPLQIRSWCPGEWFRLNNDLIDVHARTIGAIGVALYTALARYANHKTETCFPSLVRLSQQLGITHKTALKYLKVLITHQLIHVEARPGYTAMITLLDLGTPDDACVVPPAVPPEAVAPVHERHDADVPQESHYEPRTDDAPVDRTSETRGMYDVHTPYVRRTYEPEGPNQREKTSARESYTSRAREEQRPPRVPLRPDDLLCHLDADTFAQLETEARTRLHAEGVIEFLMIRPLIHSTMVSLYEQQEHPEETAITMASL